MIRVEAVRPGDSCNNCNYSGLRENNEPKRELVRVNFQCFSFTFCRPCITELHHEVEPFTLNKD